MFSIILQFSPYLYCLIILIVFISLLLSKNKFTLSNYFIAIFLIYHGPAFLIHHGEYDSLYDFNKVAFILFITVVLIYIGKWIVSYWKGKTANYIKWYNDPSQYIKINKTILIVVSLFSTSVMLIILFYYSGVDLLLSGFSIDYTDIRTGQYAKMRKETFLWQNSTVLSSIFTYLISSIAPFISFLLIGYAFKNTRSHTFHYTKIGFAIGFVVLVFLSKMVTLHKAPGVYYLIQLTILYYLINNKHINLSNLVKIIIIAGLGLTLIYMKFSSAVTPIEALKLILDRLTWVPNYCLSKYFELYPNVYPHTWGHEYKDLTHSIWTKCLYSRPLSYRYNWRNK